jgi:hypothetical protein
MRAKRNATIASSPRVKENIGPYLYIKVPVLS